MSIRAKRKLRRKAEVAAYAVEARFWIGKIKSADRILHDKPIDAQSVKLTLSSRGVEKFEANYNALHK